MTLSVFAAAPPPPPGTNYISVIKPNLTGMLIAHSFTVLLIPLVIVLLYFSTSRSRRKPIFILNIVTITLAFTTGILLDYLGLQRILSPQNVPSVVFSLVTGILGVVQSILIDTILLLRLLAVYPKSYVGLYRFVQLITLPIALKMARIINLSLFTKVLVNATKGPSASGKIADVWLHAPYLKIEWFMQLIDNTYASAFFLLRLYLRQRDNRRIQSDSHGTSSSSSVSFTEQLRILFWIAVTNFVVPVLFSLAQIIVVYREVNYSIVNDIICANTMIAVIGVVFATVWAGSSHWKENHNVGMAESDTVKQPQVLSALTFHRGEMSSGSEDVGPNSEGTPGSSRTDVEKQIV